MFQCTVLLQSSSQFFRAPSVQPFERRVEFIAMAAASLHDVSRAIGTIWGKKTAPPRLSVRCRRRDVRTRVRAAVVKDTDRIPTQVPVNVARSLAETGNGLPRNDDDDKTVKVPAVQYT